MKYQLELKNGEIKEVEILTKPLYRCRISGEGNEKYRTLAEIDADPDITLLDITDPFRFFMPYIGAIRDENHFFEAYRNLRNPIVKLTLIE